MDTLKAEQLAIKLIARHCPDYRFKWNNRITALGTCNYANKTISLAKDWTSKLPEYEVLDTILHEIAHALTRGHGHDSTWKAMAFKLGATPSARANTGLKRRDVRDPLYQMIVHTTGEVIKDYYSRPPAHIEDNIHTRYAIGRRDETLGKLRIVSCKPESPLKKLYDAGITYTGMKKRCKHCCKNDTHWQVTSNYTWLHSCGKETEHD